MSTVTKKIVFCLVVSFASPAYAQFPPIIDLNQSPADVTILGAQALARAGYAIASGDFDGDGLLDIVISSDGLNPLGGARKGEFDIVWGASLQAPGTVDLANSNGISRVFGKSTDFPLICTLASGDFNGDNVDDFIIGEPLGYTFSDGLAYVVLGMPNFPDTLDLELSPANVITIFGGPWSGTLGGGVCGCDVNGDGYDEIVVAAPAMEHGEVYLIAGGSSLASSYSMGQALAGVTRIIDDNQLQGTGRALACADFDGDGYEDLAIGAAGEGQNTWDGMVTLVYGEASLPDTISLGNTSFRVKRIFGDEYNHGFVGRHLAAGDIDDDGNLDLVVAAPVADPLGCNDCGEVYIFYDANNLPDSTGVSSTVHPMTRVIGSRGRSKYGSRVLCDDFSGDGFADVIIGSRSIDNVLTTLDTTVIYYGELVPPDTIFVVSDTSVSRIYSENHGDDLPKSLTSGDYNGDNLPDLMLATSGFDEGGTLIGRGYLFYGVPVASAVPPGAPPRLPVSNNYPNPFTTHTVIDYELQNTSDVVITIYNVLGQQVAQINRPSQPAGRQTIVWDGRGDNGQRVASGTYFYRLRANGRVETRKMIVLR